MQRTIFFFVLGVSFFQGCLFAGDKPFGERNDVQQFIHQVAKQYHFETKKLTQLFDRVHLRPRVLVKIKHPFEKTQPWYVYRPHFLNQDRIDQGVIFWRKYRTMLHRAEKTYQVPASMIVAIIGIESSYGKKTGDFPVLDSLSNIAFNYSLRQDFFRTELTEFLLLCREKHLDPLSVYGSYAGAIGQPQFMPSSFRKYAVDFSHRGSIDLVHNDVDVIGSVANYFHAYGWGLNQPVIVPATVDFTKIKRRQKALNQALITESETEPTLSLLDLENLGVTPKKYLDRKQKVGLIQLEDPKGYEYWIGLNNFFVIKHYNRSPMYAMAAYELSQEIEKEYKKKFMSHKQPESRSN